MDSVNRYYRFLMAIFCWITFPVLAIGALHAGKIVVVGIFAVTGALMIFLYGRYWRRGLGKFPQS